MNNQEKRQEKRLEKFNESIHEGISHISGVMTFFHLTKIINENVKANEWLALKDLFEIFRTVDGLNGTEFKKLKKMFVEFCKVNNVDFIFEKREVDGSMITGVIITEKKKETAIAKEKVIPFAGKETSCRVINDPDYTTENILKRQTTKEDLATKIKEWFYCCNQLRIDLIEANQQLTYKRHDLREARQIIADLKEQLATQG